MELPELAAREVVALHEFFVAWFRPGPAPDFRLCEGAFHPDFRMVTPDGRLLAKAEIIQGIQALRGRLAASLTIDVLDIRTVWQEADAALLTYIEQQYRDGRTTRRLSSALLLREASAPRGILWRHLQETWESPPAKA
ncbi:MAG TPA: DUF4440 domain-containing protein [Dongiaceae bacterium]|jgi:hypothetical protein